MPHVTIRGSRLHYEEHGSGYPLLFGASYLWDSKMWAPQVEALSRTYRCIVPDIWGHGDSGPIPDLNNLEHSGYSLELLANDMQQFVNILKLDRLAIIGISVGGMWATRLAMQMPNAIQALVLMDTYLGLEPKETQARYLEMLDAVARKMLFPHQLIDVVTSIFFAKSTAEKQPELVRQFREKLESVAPKQIPSIVEMGRAIFCRNSLLDRLTEIQCPTFFMVGKEDIPRPPHESAQMAKAIAGSRLEIIENAGHASNVEQPELVTELLTEFLSKSLSSV